MKINEIKLKEILMGLVYEANQQTREHFEAYINCVIEDSDNFLENMQTLSNFFSDKKISKQVLIIMKKITKHAVNLDENEANALFINVYGKIKVHLIESEFQLFSDFLIKYLNTVFGFNSQHSINFWQSLLNEFCFNFKSNNLNLCQFNFHLITFLDLVKFILPFLVTRNKFFVQCQKSLQQLFFQLMQSINLIGINTLIQMNLPKTVQLCLKLQEKLCIFYNDCAFLSTSFSSIFLPIMKQMDQPEQLSLELIKVAERLSKTYSKAYLIIAINTEFVRGLLQYYCSLFLTSENKRLHFNRPEKAHIYFLNLSLFTQLILDFAIDGDFSLSVSSENADSLFESVLNQNFSNLEHILLNAFRILWPSHLIRFGSGEKSLLKEHLELQNETFKNSQYVCGKEFSSALFSYYCKNFEIETEEFLKQTLFKIEQLMKIGPNELLQFDFYIWICFIESNIFRIMNLFSIDFIPEKIMNLPSSQINYFLFSFLENYFKEYEIPDSVIVLGVKFSEFWLVSAKSSCFQYITIMILLNIHFKMVARETILVEIDFKKVLKGFFELVTNCSGESSSNIFGIMNLLDEIIQCLKLDPLQVDVLLNLFNSVVDFQGYENEVPLMQKLIDSFANLLMKLDREEINLSVFQKSYMFLSKIYEKFRHSEKISYLNAFSKLFLYMIARFETFLDRVIHQIVEGSMQPEFITDFCSQMIDFMNSVCQTLFDEYIENLMINELLISLLAIGNVFSKIYVVFNCKNKIKMTPKMANTSFLIDIKWFEPRISIAFNSIDFSMIQIHIETDIGNVGYMKLYLDCLMKCAITAVKIKNYEFYKGVLNVLEFFAQCFPFFIEEMCCIAFESFDVFQKQPPINQIEIESQIFLSIYRLMALSIFCFPRNMISSKLQVYNRITTFLKQIKFQGRYQESLCQGILLVEYLQITTEKWNEDLLTLFSSMSLKTDDPSSIDNTNVYVILNILELILMHIDKLDSNNHDVPWENFKEILQTTDDLKNLVSSKA